LLNILFTCLLVDFLAKLCQLSSVQLRRSVHTFNVLASVTVMVLMDAYVIGCRWP